MLRLFPLPGAVRRDPAVDTWFDTRPGELGAIARARFQEMRACGDDVRELLHDGHPTACVGEVAFGYVDSFKAHVNVGFFVGPELPDPAGVLEGSGKFMRHVKLRCGAEVDVAAVRALTRAAYEILKTEAGSRPGSKTRM